MLSRSRRLVELGTKIYEERYLDSSANNNNNCSSESLLNIDRRADVEACLDPAVDSVHTVHEDSVSQPTGRNGMMQTVSGHYCRTMFPLSEVLEVQCG